MQEIILNMSKPKAYKHIIENYDIPFKLRDYMKWQLNYDNEFRYIDKVFKIEAKENKND